jgi:amino acid transporter
VPYILAQLPSWLQDFALLLLVFAFFSCGTSIQGAGSRLMFSFARDGALPRARWIASVHPRFKTPVNALLSGAVVTVLFVLFVFATPSHDLKILWFTYPAHTSALVSLVSFGVSGIYLSFFLTVLGAGIARARGWVPEGKFQLGKWAWPVIIVGGLYLLVMFINMVVPTGLASPRGAFNLDWITLLVMVIVFIVGVLVFFLSRGGKEIDSHLRDDMEKPAAVR